MKIEEFENEWNKVIKRRGSVYIYDTNDTSIHANKYIIDEYYEEDYDYEYTKVYLYYNDVEIAIIDLSFIREVL